MTTTQPNRILNSAPPMPPRPAPPPTWHHAPPGVLRIEIHRPFRTAWMVGLGLFAAGWTVTLLVAALWLLSVVVLAGLFGVALAGAGA